MKDKKDPNRMLGQRLFGVAFNMERVEKDKVLSCVVESLLRAVAIVDAADPHLDAHRARIVSEQYATSWRDWTESCIRFAAYLTRQQHGYAEAYWSEAWMPVADMTIFFGAMNALCPPGMFFGALPHQPDIYGFWWSRVGVPQERCTHRMLSAPGCEDVDRMLKRARK